MDQRDSLAVIIPAYNEEKGIAELVQRAKKKACHVIVVDDGSQDKTCLTAKESGATVLQNEKNCGKGASIIKGVRWSLEKNLCPVVLIDADGQHPPEIIDDFYSSYRSENADIIIGNRMRDPGDMPFVRRSANAFMSWLTSFFLGMRLHDTQCGYRLYGKRAMELHRDIDFQCRRFDYDSEILFYASAVGLTISEVDIPSIYIRGRKSRIHPIKDTIRWVKSLITIRQKVRTLRSDEEKKTC